MDRQTHGIAIANTALAMRALWRRLARCNKNSIGWLNCDSVNTDFTVEKCDSHTNRQTQNFSPPPSSGSLCSPNLTIVTTVMKEVHTISVVTVAEICNSVGGGVLFDTPPRCRWRWRMSAVCTALWVRFNHLSRSLSVTPHHTAHVNRHRRR